LSFYVNLGLGSSMMVGRYKPAVACSNRYHGPAHATVPQYKYIGG